MSIDDPHKKNLSQLHTNDVFLYYNSFDMWQRAIEEMHFPLQKTFVLFISGIIKGFRDTGYFFNITSRDTGY